MGPAGAKVTLFWSILLFELLSLSEVFQIKLFILPYLLNLGLTLRVSHRKHFSLGRVFFISWKLCHRKDLTSTENGDLETTSGTPQGLQCLL